MNNCILFVTFSFFSGLHLGCYFQFSLDCILVVTLIDQVCLCEHCCCSVSVIMIIFNLAVILD